MGSDKEVILYEGIAHPVKCEKIRYYEDKRFKARLLPRVDIRQLNLTRAAPIEKQTKAVATASRKARDALGQMAVAA